MAQKQLKIINNRGQALLETFFLLGTTGLFLFFLLRALLSVIFTIAVDAMAEDYFYCELAQKKNCTQQLEHRLKANQLRDVNVETKNQQQKITLLITGTHLTTVKVEREFDYGKFRKKY